MELNEREEETKDVFVQSERGVNGPNDVCDSSSSQTKSREANRGENISSC